MASLSEHIGQALDDVDVVSVVLCVIALTALLRGDHEIAVIAVSALAGALNPIKRTTSQGT